MEENKNQMTDNMTTDRGMLSKTHADGVLMKEGKMILVKDGELTLLDKDIVMSNGTQVKSDGNIIKKDGSEKLLKEGEHIDL